MKAVSQLEADETEHRIDEETRVFGPCGFAIVTYVNRQVGEALVKPIRIDQPKARAYPLEELEIAADEEWPLYSEVPGGEADR